MAFGIKIEGDKELQKLFKLLPSQIGRRAIRGALIASAKPILKQAKQNVKIRRRTGRLMRSIKSKSAKSGKRQVKAEVVVLVGPTGDGFHGVFLEVGTKRQKKTPFLAPAVEAKANEHRRILANELGPRIMNEARKLATKLKTKGR